MEGIEAFILDEVWGILANESIQLKGQDVYQQNFIDDLRNEVINLNDQHKNAQNSIEELSNKFSGLDLLIDWFNWHTATGKGIIYSKYKKTFIKSQNNGDNIIQQMTIDEQEEITKIKKEKVKQIFAIDASQVRFNYKGLQTIQGPIDDKFDVFEMPDLFYINYLLKSYLCFGGEKHALIQYRYHNHSRDKKNTEFGIQTNVKLLEKFKNNNFMTNFIFNIEQEAIRVIILEQIDYDQDKTIFIELLKPQSRLPELTIETLIERKWSYYINKDKNQIFAIKEKSFIAKLNEIYNKCKQENVDYSEWLQVGKKKQVFSCEVNKLPFALDPQTLDVYQYSFKQEKNQFQWNVIETFKFPKNYNDGKYQKVNEFTYTEILNRESFEFKYVAFKFLLSKTGRDPRLNEIQSAVDKMYKEIDQVNLGQVVEIKKILDKQTQVLSLLKHLFHGSRKNDPQNILSFENGLDMRYSNNGAHGIGLYFADNSQYSLNYAYNQNGKKQMFLCTVITGLSSSSGGGQGARMPAAIPGKQGELFDSFNNGLGGHFVVYDNQKSYPGYLITF
ncbi:poly adp-ribose polymerase member 14-like protein [Stylonychia lemnae]|uniref:Poly [ADP-ribose] polymerase n=1 Tax=Stylonychia lemnae TaxID=5949 RepID=A0A078AYA7_STYLE|nr:poly adp-ribose polymerase member 14-like protein [Stylonychia lemnae]|eukprot:CDW87149.1 poly adp-ribose polymerase member 14-like protein [Stylonychia lemnae]